MVDRVEPPDLASHAGYAGHAGHALFTLKDCVRVGCWNVRSLGKPTRQNSRLRDVLRTMREKKIELLALSEVRWPGHGVSQLDGTVIIHSGMAESEPQHRRRGVAVVLEKRAASAWRLAGSEFTPVSERILRTRLKSHTGHVSVIAVYAPTNEAGNEEETKKFYQALQDCVSETPKRDMLLVMGDFNARVGNDADAWRGTIGRFGPEQQNRNGVKLLDFCAFNSLVVTNTLFQHRFCHQQTWFHPAETTGSGHLMDYVLVNRRFRSSVLDRVFRKTYLQSDHRLVVARVRLKLKAKRRRSQREPRYQTDRRLLEEHQVQEFARVLEEGLECCTASSIEQSWSEFKDTINEAQKTLPLVPEKEEKDWVTEKVREVSRMKQEAWMRWVKKPGDVLLKAQYQQLKAQSRKAADEAREAWWEAKAEEADRLHEAAVRHGRGGSLLKDLRLLQRGQKLRASTALLTADGRAKLTSTADKLERWREHFDEVCNVSTEVMESVLDTIPEVLPQGADGNSNESLSSEPTEEEIRAAVKQLKSGRAPGVDMITAELLKLGEEAVVQWLTKLAGSIWHSESVPDDWVKQLTIPLHKKGAHDQCDNFRGIALLSVPGKVFCRVIQRRLAESGDQLLRENQCGFRKGRGCVDQVFALRVLAEKYNTPLYLCFVDLKKAYDSVNRNALWTVLKKRYRVPDKLLRILKALHRDTRGAVRMARYQASFSSRTVYGRVMYWPPHSSTFSLTQSSPWHWHSTRAVG